MCKYIAFYKGQKVEVEAVTTFEAQTKAAKLLGAKKRWEVTVMLTHRADGSEVIHDGASL